MRIWRCTIKEKGNDHLLTPELWGDDYTNEETCVKHWGLNEPDIEWYKLEEITDKVKNDK